MLSERPTKFTRRLDALTEEAVRRSLENIRDALFIRYGQLGREPVEERGWLIEWLATPEPQPRWWHPVHGWSSDASRAIRYARKVDAEAAIERGCFCNGVVATEHSWLAPSTEGPDER